MASAKRAELLPFYEQFTAFTFFSHFPLELLQLLAEFSLFQRFRRGGSHIVIEEDGMVAKNTSSLEKYQLVTDDEIITSGVSIWRVRFDCSAPLETSYLCLGVTAPSNINANSEYCFQPNSFTYYLNGCCHNTSTSIQSAKKDYCRPYAINGGNILSVRVDMNARTMLVSSESELRTVPSGIAGWPLLTHTLSPSQLPHMSPREIPMELFCGLPDAVQIGFVIGPAATLTIV